MIDLIDGTDAVTLSGPEYRAIMDEITALRMSNKKLQKDYRFICAQLAAAIKTAAEGPSK